MASDTTDPPAQSARCFKIPESVLVVIHSAEGDVLLLERADHPGFWQSVTGSKDAVDEPLEAACWREVGEEAGIAVGRGCLHAACLHDWHLSNVFDIYPAWRHRYEPGVTRNTEHVFGLRVARNADIRLAPREHLRYEWLGLHAAAERCFSPSNAEAILLLPRFMERVLLN